MVKDTIIPTATPKSQCIDNPAIGFTRPSPTLANLPTPSTQSQPAVDCTATHNDPSCPITPPTSDPCTQDPNAADCNTTPPYVNANNAPGDNSQTPPVDNSQTPADNNPPALAGRLFVPAVITITIIFYC